MNYAYDVTKEILFQTKFSKIEKWGTQDSEKGNFGYSIFQKGNFYSEEKLKNYQN